jgi:hypothetical protein
VIATDGTYLVGTDILPGMYRTPGRSSCYWARLRSLDTSDIIDNNNSTGPQVIESSRRTGRLRLRTARPGPLSRTEERRNHLSSRPRREPCPARATNPITTV